VPQKTAKKATPRALHAARFPGESRKYRAARDQLLKSEIALRRQTEAVAAARRKLPLGGAVLGLVRFARSEALQASIVRG